MTPAPRVIHLHGGPRDGWVQAHPAPLAWPDGATHIRLRVWSLLATWEYHLPAAEVRGAVAHATFVRTIEERQP